MTLVPRILLLGLAPLVCLLAAPPAHGYSEFQKEFRRHYLRGSGVDKDFRKLVMKAKCFVCHRAGETDDEDDKPNNRYGEAMAEHVGEADKKDKKKIVAAIKLIADEPSDPDDASSPTFGDLIESGELPGGPLDEVKKRPGEAS